MRKKSMAITSVILIILLVFFGVYFVLSAPKFAGNFTVSDFGEYLENEDFQTDINYGEITDYRIAANAGKKAIAECFENAEGGIFEWMGCFVYYDLESDTYYICTYHLLPFINGGAYDVILKSDGTILAVWGEK